MIFPEGALTEPTAIGLFVPEEGVVMVVVGGKGGMVIEPDLVFGKPVKLVIKSRSIELPDEPLYLWYLDGEEWVEEGEVEVKVKKNGTVKLWGYIGHSSRYGLAPR